MTCNGHTFTFPAITVAPATANITASEPRIVKSGAETLKWWATGVTSCSVTDNIPGDPPLAATSAADTNENWGSGSLNIGANGSPDVMSQGSGPETQTVYTISCSTVAGGTVSNKTIVNISGTIQGF